MRIALVLILVTASLGFGQTSRPDNVVTTNAGKTNTFAGPVKANNGLTAATTTISQINQDILMDGTNYTTVAAAVAALPSGGTLRISAGTYTISATINFVSNLDIECSPNNATILQASASLNAPMFLASGVNNIRMTGCVLDGNKANNANTFDLFQLLTTTQATIERNHFQNNVGNCLRMGNNTVGGNSYIKIEDNEFDHYGIATAAFTGIGIVSMPGSGNGNTHVLISNNKVHDGNTGLAIFPSQASSTAEFDIEHNRLYSHYGDGFELYSVGITNNQLTTGIRLIGNEAFCNGWPANGTGFSTGCTAGYLQTGSIASGNGVGIDLNSGTIVQPLIVGNSSHDNYFEGFDVTPLLFTTVNTQNAASGGCASNCAIWVSGDNFNPQWKQNQGVRINGTNFLISACQGTQTTCQLTTAPGTQTGVQLVGSALSRATITGNIAYRNGFGNNSSSGHGFADIGAYGNTYTGNSSYLNQGLGYIDQITSFTSHTADKAWDNDGNGGGTAGFLCQGCNSPAYFNVQTDDSRSSPNQTVGVTLDSQTTHARVASIFNIQGGISDNGADNTIESYSKFMPSSSTNAGSTISTKVVLLQPTSSNNSYILQLNVFQVTLGVGCSAGSNTATINYTFTDPTGTAHTNVAGPTLTMATNGTLGSYVSQVISFPSFASAQFSWNTTSTLASTGCGTIPQYQASVKLIG